MTVPRPARRILGWKTLLVATALTCAGDAGTAAQVGAQTPAAWDSRFYNPTAQAVADDVILPLPCGGAMAFRRITTPPEEADPLGDRSVRLGRKVASTGYLDSHRSTYLLGTLSGSDGGWYFLLGKYPVTVNQWDAVANIGRCTAPTDAGHHPKGDLSWFDAVDYARRLTEWLLRERKGVLPMQDRTTSFLRLPTEPEWEYAARGGAEVQPVEFSAERFFPESERASTYVVFRERGRDVISRPVGSRKPNQLKLYDILGNIEQWVFDPFHANRQGREHGQSGGVVTRGGSFETEEENVRTSLRYEYPPYDTATGLAWHRPKIGFRLAVAAPVLSSATRTDLLQKTWIELDNSSARTPEGSAVVPGIDRMAAETQDKALRTNLEALKHDIQVERGRRDEVENGLFRNALKNGAFAVRSLRQDAGIAEAMQHEVEINRQIMESARRRGDAASEQQFAGFLRESQLRYQGADQRRRFATRAYTDAIVQLAKDVRAGQQDAQRDILVKELKAGDLGDLISYLDLFDRALGTYRARPDMGSDALVGLILDKPGRTN